MLIVRTAMGEAEMGARSHDAPYEEVHLAAVAAVDLLRRLAAEPGEGSPPLPAEGDVVRFLVRTHPGRYPRAVGCPEWLTEAWRSCDLPAEVRAPHPTPPADGGTALERLRSDVAAGTAAGDRASAHVVRLAAAYEAGALTAADIVEEYPARWTMPIRVRFNHKRARHAFERELRALLTSSLGTDPTAWLKLLTAVDAACRPDCRDPGALSSWAALVKQSQDTVAASADLLLPQRKPVGGKVEDQLFRAQWWWPAGEVLRRCDTDVLDAVMTELTPNLGTLLAQYVVALRIGTPRAVLEHFLRSRNRDALLVIARGIDLTPGTALRLLAYGDPEIHLAVLGHHFYVSAEERRRVVTDPAVQLAPHADRIPWNALPDCLHAVEPELIEAAFASTHRAKFKMQEQLTGCLNLLRHGGPSRLSGLLATGHVGPAVTRICEKALTADDPEAALRARAAKELTTPKLAARLRRLGPRAGADAADRLMELFPEPDWPYLEAEHAREPFRYWPQMLNRPGTPPDVAARNIEAIRRDYRRHRSYPESWLTDDGVLRAGLDHSADQDGAAEQLEDLLTAGLLTPDDLLRRLGQGPCVLRVLGDARRRPDAPPQIGETVEQLAALVRAHLPVGDEEAWQRLYRRLTGSDPHHPERGTIEELLAA
ncbi:hypothetical protein [Streptomyces ficellus]|uniref:Uncharacterized protein n=1 Tax=Streptomyces ficellus TaxID=1977088 RepID=A0A6I6EYT9_9ACTN|nr:hypothetical protein [Streptomyces ficellus]QGV76863.1 hypothetical protein EIZ62_00200 [Streptomyces ficellus]